MPANKVMAVASVLLLSACGHYAPPETFEAKMARYQVNSGSSNVIPQIEPIAFRAGGSRGPASVAPDAEGEKVGFSNKKLYFVTLYRQYNQLASYSSSTPREITQCPNFHSALVDHSEVAKPTVSWKPSYDTSKLNDESYTRYHPELYLPMTSSSATPRVIDILKSNTDDMSVLQSAIDRHVDKTYSELAELCEYGSSDNYYAFENLHTEIKRRDVATPGPSGMRVLLKTTVFSNKALIESLSRWSKSSSRAPASAVQAYDYDGEVMKRFGVPWAKNYFYELKNGQ